MKILNTNEQQNLNKKEPQKFQGKNKKPDDLIKPFSMFIINESLQ